MEAHVEVTTSLMFDCNTFKDKRHLLILAGIWFSYAKSYRCATSLCGRSPKGESVILKNLRIFNTFTDTRHLLILVAMSYAKSYRSETSLLGRTPKSRWMTYFIVLIHPIQWTIANPVGADRPAKRQKKTSCVSTGRPVPVLCTRKVAHHTFFLSRQSDIIASFSFGACTVQMCSQQSPDILRKSVDYDKFATLFANNLL